MIEVLASEGGGGGSGLPALLAIMGFIFFVIFYVRFRLDHHELALRSRAEATMATAAA